MNKLNLSLTFPAEDIGSCDAQIPAMQVSLIQRPESKRRTIQNNEKEEEKNLSPRNPFYILQSHTETFIRGSFRKKKGDCIL